MMSESVVRFGRAGIQYIRDHPQLIFTVLLIALVPAAFLVNSQQFLSVAREHQERIEMDRVQIIHDLLAPLIARDINSPDSIATTLKALALENPDLTSIRVVMTGPEGLYHLVTLEPELWGTTVERPETYRAALLNPDRATIFPVASAGERLWQSFSVIPTDAGEAFLFVEVSLAQIDSRFATEITRAYWWLIGLSIVVLLLLIRHVRLVDYAELYRKAKAANEMRDLFTHMITHELRAPLTAIRGYSSLIREDKETTPRVREEAERIEDSAGRLIGLVTDLLDVARINAGKLAIEKNTVAVSTVVQSVLRDQGVVADDKKITLRPELPHEPVYIMGDEKRLYQVLTNLVSNAIKYTPTGTIAVSVTASANRVEVRVKDTGMGISAADQQKLFSPFFRVESQAVSQITGTGLGMWITKELVNLMGGSIGVESIQNVGTHVVMVFPKP
jgi:signal transduction histidine kinase